MTIDAGRIWYWSTLAHRQGHARLARALKGLNFLMFRSLLPFEAELAGPPKLEHFGLGMVVHPNVAIGRRVRIYHHVTLAAEVPVGAREKIHIGDDVTIGAGAIVIGRGYRDLFIGDGATVGAGAVVTGDVAAGQCVAGVPARAVVSRDTPTWGSAS